MYLPEEKLFVFHVRRSQSGLVYEGLSPRYTAITLIGLAEEEISVKEILGTHSAPDVMHHMVSDIDSVENLGDAALMLWAAKAIGYPNRGNILERLIQLDPAERSYPTVELAWTLDSLCLHEGSPSKLRATVAERVMSSFNPKVGLFPHVIGDGSGGMRSHVSCFADLVYPIHALSNYYKVAGDKKALEAASICSKKICDLQGKDGQWWWHYDYRTGEVIEGYPVYAVHQDAMAPMALFALKEAGGPDLSENIQKGLEWLYYSPEIDGSLIDEENGVIWRKVARKEPKKLTRTVQAAVSRVRLGLRVPGVDVLFPPKAVDWESRPYHMGWLLYAWPKTRAEEWDKKYSPRRR
jgi:hypothetical protein